MLSRYDYSHTLHERFAQLDPLAEDHRDHLRQSALYDDYIDGLGWRSFGPEHEAVLGAMLGRPAGGLGRGIAIPYRNTAGQVACVRLRPDKPRLDKDGRPKKYEHPSRTVLSPYVAGDTDERLAGLQTPLVITEGEKKAEFLAMHGYAGVGLPGVWGFTAGKRSRALHPEFIGRLRVAGRECVVVFDGEIHTRKQDTVRQAAEKLRAYLLAAGATRVRTVEVPVLWGEKTGVDDWAIAKDTDGSALTRLLFDPPLTPPVDEEELSSKARFGVVVDLAARMREPPPSSPAIIGRPALLYKRASFVMLDAAIAAREDIGSGPKVLYSLLADRFWSSRLDAASLLAKHLDEPKQKIHRWARELEEVGLVEVVRDADRAAGHRPNRYRPGKYDGGGGRIYLSNYLVREPAGLSWEAVLVAGVLRTKAGEDGWAGITRASLATAIGRGFAVVDRAIQELLAGGFVGTRPGRDGRHQIYEFLVVAQLGRHLIGAATLADCLAPAPDDAGPMIGGPASSNGEPGSRAASAAFADNVRVREKGPLPGSASRIRS